MALLYTQVAELYTQVADRSLFPSEHRNFAPDPVVMASALRAQTPSGVSIGSSGR